MNDLVLTIPPRQTAAPPLPRCPVSVRVATVTDLPFIDRLQKMHGKMVGWMPTKSLEQKIAAGQVVVAEERHEGTEARRHEGTKARREGRGNREQ